jgi:predicted MFS family arabinose efflux permease
MVVPFLTVYLTASRGYSAADASWIMVAFGSGGVVGNYVGGLLNDRFGSWHIQLFSLFGSGLIFIVLGQIDDYLLFCLTIFLLSVVADSFRPANRAAVAIYSPPDRLTKAYGLQRMAVNLGFSLGPILGGWIVAMYSYKTLFWVDGITCLLSGVAFLYLLPKDETAVPLVEEVKPPLAGQVIKAQTLTVPGHRQFWLLLVCAANVLVATCFFQLFNTVPVYLEKVGYSILQIGYIFTLSGLLIVAFEMPLLFLTEKRFQPLPVLLIGSALIVISYFILPLAVTIGMAGIALFTVILTVGEMLYMPFGNTFVAQHAPPARRGEYLGILSASYSLAFVLSPLLGLNAAEWIGFDAATYLVAAGGGIGFLLLWWLWQSGFAREVRRGRLAG